ncbi:Predicted Peptidoglycan domain-containing protein [Malonomonas rubra DSM 5091]|uniref:Predicted Peptidoglycan domain-containing protein n=1 Tax=Malonomonas rubra DSM 5091 TaxID=1122189 RepID=A0A1M6I707_MALRU|nr:glycosyl hydrolase 108 family protein [Malonomonas rubra]SHJ30206.1 Predicted Peptidoglycan domain-containing protein [Malonomonas rubra DSM 5091]
MADFESAFKITLGHEGGYVFDPDDAGGETYRGVSRRYHPGWVGWSSIDRLKQQAENRRQLNRLLAEDDDLQLQIRDFYKQHYWDRFQGDAIDSQQLAEELFDTGVNMGVHRAVRFMQEGLNLLNRNQKSFKDILEDGKSGPGTLAALNAYLAKDPAEHLLKIMNVLQGMHYIDYMRKSPAQEKYARGWLKRVCIGNAK